MKTWKHLMVEPGEKCRLAEIDPDKTSGGAEKEDAEGRLAKAVEALTSLTQTLWADNRYGLLVVLQGMDASGKDGTVRSVLSGLNPQVCRVESFKRPTAEELDHDYLWRVHKLCPRRGELVVFNRSHYEDVGVVRVHKLVPKDVWSKRYDQINAFERHLTECGTVVVKFFLHISRREQKERLLERVNDPMKAWKMELADLKEREHWDEYMEAYSDAIRECSTREAPWMVVPADRKWFRNIVIAETLVERLRALDLRLPKPDFDPASVHIPD